MERFRADLHIHSRYSRGTSRSLTTRKLAAWARVKGITVVGTGDFTHSGWRAELREALRPDERTGLLVLKDETGLKEEIPELDSPRLAGRTLFMLQTEISSIYKRGDKVRKVHNLVFMPTLDAAEAFSRRLAKVGNLESDGRPILGLDSRHLLEMTLETDPLAFLVPAHIWTPWFSVFGAKSGFDSLEECYGSLAEHIFALETGLSSDPPMNRLISALDRCRLISNSDAHSAEKLGRECNLFDGQPSYEGIFRSLRGESLGRRFLGTVEFFPEEGKYHLDGHRKCGVVFEPHETRARSGVCPVCGKQLTLGVLHRVLQLADRDSPVEPGAETSFASLIPLTELVGEVLNTGPTSKRVAAMYARLIARFGAELTLLQDAPLDDVKKISLPLAEGLGRMRSGNVLRDPGFDGQYGVIRVFTANERKDFGRKRLSPGPGTTSRQRTSAPTPDDAASPRRIENTDVRKVAPQATLNAAQQLAVSAGPGPVLVIAGPGTGKTHTLIQRIVTSVRSGVNPRHILAVTFTRRAAQELQSRLLAEFGENSGIPRADTLHALAFEYWAQAYAETPVLLSEESAFQVFCEANADATRQRLRPLWKQLCLQRELRQDLADLRDVYHPYVKLKESWNLADYTDLLEFWLEQIVMNIYVCPYTRILVDEIQDLTPLQLAVVKALLPKAQNGGGGEGLFAIGDPHQSIYAFRGAISDVQGELQDAWPGLHRISLTDNYRSSQPILDFAAGLFAGEGGNAPAPLKATSTLPATIRLFEAPTETSEAAWIAGRIRWLVGGASHTQADRTRTGSAADDEALHAALSPGDIAVLVRLKALIPAISRVLDRLGLPVSVPEAEAFWVEPRVATILASAGAFLGIVRDPELPPLDCPDKILAKGPLALAAYLQEMPPFDRLFWQTRAFRELSRAYDEQGGWAGLINWVNLQTESELAGRRSEKIRIMTLHAAKGLEFRAVFLPALEDGILPFAGPALLRGKAGGDNDQPSEAEEKRLLYVGLTRARQALFLSHAGLRQPFGRELRLKPSRFLSRLPVDGIGRSVLKSHTRRKVEQLTLR